MREWLQEVVARVGAVLAPRTRRAGEPRRVDVDALVAARLMNMASSEVEMQGILLHCCAACVRNIESTMTRRRRRHLPVGFVRACCCCEACVRARRRCPSERAVSVRGVESTTLRACVRVVVAGVELSVRGVDSTTRAPQGTAGGAVVTVRAWQARSILLGCVCWGGCQHRRAAVVDGARTTGDRGESMDGFKANCRSNRRSDTGVVIESVCDEYVCDHKEARKEC